MADNNEDCVEMEIKQISREQAAYFVFMKKMEVVRGKDKETIIEEFSNIYIRYLAICSSEKFDEEINKLGIQL